MLRIGATRAATQTLFGDGMDTSLAVGPFDRTYADGAFFLFFANTDQSKNGTDPTLTGPDQARFMSATRAFPGRTAGQTGPGSNIREWVGEFGAPDLTLPNLDNTGETRAHYFTRGLFIDYDGSQTATSYTVARTSRLPNERIDFRTRKLGSINALSSGGSALSAVESAWGAPDQIDDYDVFTGVKGRNYTYVNMGLVFVGVTQFLGSTYSVNSIIFFDPYYGRADIASLGVRSTRQEFDTALVTGACPATMTNFINQSWRVYKVGATAGGTCNIKVGVVFDAQNRARTIFLGFPDNV